MDSKVSFKAVINRETHYFGLPCEEEIVLKGKVAFASTHPEKQFDLACHHADRQTSALLGEKHPAVIQ